MDLFDRPWEALLIGPPLCCWKLEWAGGRICQDKKSPSPQALMCVSVHTEQKERGNYKAVNLLIMNRQLPRSSLYSCAVVSCKAERTKSRDLVSPFPLCVLWRHQGLAILSPYYAVYQAIIKKKEITPSLLACKRWFGIGNQKCNGARCREKLKTKVCFQKVDEWEDSNLIQKFCLQLNKQCIFSLCQSL